MSIATREILKEKVLTIVEQMIKRKGPRKKKKKKNLARVNRQKKTFI
jgi:hypothetical protein